MKIAISGKMGAGKDTVASMLGVPFVHLSLAEPMKEICQKVFGWSRTVLWGPSQFRNAPDPDWGGLTPRRALQTLGTEWGRGCHPDLWIRYLIRMASEYPSTAIIVCTDARFPNELDALRNAGWFMVRVKRPRPLWDRVVAWLRGPGRHPSETAQDAVPDSFFDYVLENDGTLDDLREKVQGLPL